MTTNHLLTSAIRQTTTLPLAQHPTGSQQLHLKWCPPFGTRLVIDCSPAPTRNPSRIDGEFDWRPGRPIASEPSAASTSLQRRRSQNAFGHLSPVWKCPNVVGTASCHERTARGAAPAHPTKRSPSPTHPGVARVLPNESAWNWPLGPNSARFREIENANQFNQPTRPKMTVNIDPL